MKLNKINKKMLIIYKYFANNLTEIEFEINEMSLI